MTFGDVFFFLGGDPSVLESPQLGSAGRVQLKLVVVAAPPASSRPAAKLREPLIPNQPRGGTAEIMTICLCREDMNRKCSKLIICKLWVEVEVARCSGPDVCQRLPKPVNGFAPRPGSAGTCRLCWGHECQMSGTANSLCLVRLFQHFMFTLNAAELNVGSVFPFWWRTKHFGDQTAAVDAGSKPA